MSSLLHLVAGLSSGQVAGVAIGAVAAVAALSVGGFFVVRYIRRSGYRRSLLALKKTCADCESKLESQCGSYMKRLATIGERSADHRLKSQECEAIKNDILRSQLTAAKSAIDTVETSIKKAAFRGISRYIATAEGDVRDLKDAIESLESKLRNYLAEDGRLHDEITQVKEKLAHFKEFNQENSNTLSFIQPVLDFLYKGLNEQFEYFETLLDQADYQRAQLQLESIRMIVDALIQYEGDLLRTIPAVTSTLPAEFKRIYEDYRKLSDDGIPLDHLNVEIRLKEMSEEVQGIRRSLSSLDIGHCTERVEALERQVSDISASFRAEVDAREELSQRSDDFPGSVYALQDAALKAQDFYASQSKRYVIDPDRVQWIDSIKDRLDEINSSCSIYCELEAASLRPPFTELLKRAKGLDRDIQKLRGEIDDFNDYLKGLDSDVATLRIAVNSYYQKAEELYATILDTGIADYVGEAAPKVEELLDRLDGIYDALAAEPADPVKSGDMYAEADRIYQDLFAKVESEVDACRSAEGLLVEINAYRRSYDMSREGLQEAERDFLSGQFVRAHRELESIKQRLEANIEAQTGFAPVQ